MKDVLLLNADFTPIGVLDWERAICLVMSRKVSRVIDYVGLNIRSQHVSFPWPAVVHLEQYVGIEYATSSLSRRNVLARDRWTCQYCSRRPEEHGRPMTGILTLDHVVPRAQAHGTTVVKDGRRVPLHGWENLVTCCRPCNTRKGGRTPQQAGMRLLSQPRTPGPLDSVRIVFSRVMIEEEWRPFLPSLVAV